MKEAKKTTMQLKKQGKTGLVGESGKKETTEVKLKLKLTITSSKRTAPGPVGRVAMKHWRNSPNIYRTPIVVIWSTVIHNSQTA